MESSKLFDWTLLEGGQFHSLVEGCMIFTSDSNKALAILNENVLIYSFYCCLMEFIFFYISQNCGNYFLQTLLWNICVLIFLVLNYCDVCAHSFRNCIRYELNFLHPEWNSDVKQSLFLGVFLSDQNLLSSPNLDSWRRFWYFLCQLIFNRFIEFSHLGVKKDFLS